MKKFTGFFLIFALFINILQIMPVQAVEGEQNDGFLEMINNAKYVNQIEEILENFPEYRPGAGTVYLYKGLNKIKIETDAVEGAAFGDSTVRVDGITLKGETQTIEIEGLSYNSNESYLINSSYGTADFYEDGYLVYDFDVPAEGAYSIEINMAVNKSYSIPVSVYVNGCLMAKKNHQTNTTPSANGYLIFKSFDLESESVFYPEEVYGYLIGKDFETIADYFDVATKQFASKEQNPVVSLFADEKKVADVQSGNLKVKVSPSVKTSISIVSAVYDGNRLISIDIETADGKNETVLELGEHNLDNPSVELFFYDDFENAVPTDFYGASKMSVFVSDKGNDDTGNGTQYKPFASIEKAKEYVNAIKNDVRGDVVVNIMSGKYFITKPLEFKPEDGGVGEHSVVYRGESRENMPLISGGVEVTRNWEEYKNGIYKVFVPEVYEARAMYINGVSAQRAISDSVYVASDTYDDPSTAYTEDGFVLSGTELSEIARPEDLEMVAPICWAMQRLPVKSLKIEEGNTIVSMDQPSYDSYISAINNGGIQPKAGSIFYFENALEFIDEPGEFYFNPESRELYYYPFSSENLSEAEVYLPKSEGILNISGSASKGNVKNLSFKNLDIRYGAYNEVTSNGLCTIQADCLIPYNMHGVEASSTGPSVKAQISVKKAENILFKGCNFSCLGSAAISMHESVKNSVLTGNAIHDISGTGIIIGSWKYNANSDTNTLCDNIMIENNVITRAAQEFMGCVGIGIYYAKNVSVLNNVIKDLPYTGITLGWGWGSETPTALGCGGHIIKGNRIEYVMYDRVDGGHIYMLGNLGNTLISDNYMVGSYDLGGIYLDSGTENVTITDNVLKDCNQWLFINTTAGNGAVVDNNYVDANNYSVASDNQNDYYIANTQVLKYGLWKGESAQIVENAGVKSALRGKIPYFEDSPLWRTSAYEYVPKTEKLSSDEYLIEGEDFMPGGYYILYGGSPTVYSLPTGRTVIGNFRPREWCEYSVDVKTAGTYQLEMRCSTGPDVYESLPKVSVYVDSIENIREVELYDKSMPWNTFLSMNVGTIELEEGKNVIRIKNMNQGWTYDNFKLSLISE